MERVYWTLEKLSTALEKFRSEKGHYPTALEVDATEYLPSSRFIQLKFGGLEKVRKDLGHTDTHFGKGSFRSAIAYRVNARGRVSEKDLERFLVNKFGEPFVHAEKIFDQSKKRLDFYIYSPDGNFGIDIFYPESKQTVISNVNIKVEKYRNFTLPLYLVVANKQFSQKYLDTYSLSKTKMMSENIRIVTLGTLNELLGKMHIYKTLIVK